MSGPIGAHGATVLLAQAALDIECALQSDTAPLHTLVASLLDRLGDQVHSLKDPTRGGVATSLNEMAQTSEIAVVIDEVAIPVQPDVRGICEILGLDPLTIANEGKFLAVVAPEAAEMALATMRAHPLGQDAAIIGSVQAEPAAMVFMHTEIGGKRVLDMLVGDPLPRIC